jgi:hypothetical protein
VRQAREALARISNAVAQQKTAQWLAGFTLGVKGILSAADQIEHGLVIFLRDINRCEPAQRIASPNLIVTPGQGMPRPSKPLKPT